MIPLICWFAYKSEKPMETQVKKTSDVDNEIIVSLNLPEDFICTCEIMNITYKQAIVTYLEHIKIYNHFFNEDDGANSEATAVFKKFELSQLKNQGVKVTKHHKLHLAPLKEILRLGMDEKGSESQEYIDVIEKWYEKISKAK